MPLPSIPRFHYDSQSPHHCPHPWAIYICSLSNPFTFFLLSTIFYWLWYYSCPSTQHPPLPQAISTPLFMSMGLWLLRFLYCTLYPHGYSVTTYLYFLIPSPLHPFLHTLSQLATIKMLSVSMILCLFLFPQFFRFSGWQVCIYCHFIIRSFDLSLFLK